MTANLHPKPTWEEKQDMTYKWQITGAVPSASLEHFSFSNGSRQTSGNALDNVIVNLDGTVPAGYHTADVSLSVYDTNDAVIASGSTNIKFTVINVELIRNAPGNPCLVGSRFDYECKVTPSTVTVGNYAWKAIINCKTAPTDPYECPAFRHNTDYNGPSGAGLNTWVSGSTWAHAGEHTVQCTVTVGGADCIATIAQEVQPKIKVSNVTIESPASDKSWPYDPVWDDSDWSLTVDGSAAVVAASDVDGATINYTLNKDAVNVLVKVYRNVFGTDNPLEESITSVGVSRGVNTATWKIGDEDKDDYFVLVTAQGAAGASDIDDDKSPSYDITRTIYFTGSPIYVSDDESFYISTWEGYMNQALVDAGVVVTCTIGKPVIMSIKVAKYLGLVAGVAANVGMTSPINVNGWGIGDTHYAFETPCMGYRWNSANHAYVSDSVALNSLHKILGRTCYDKGVGYPPGPASTPVSWEFPTISSPLDGGFFIHGNPRHYGGDWYDELVYEQRPVDGSGNCCQRGLKWELNFGTPPVP